MDHERVVAQSQVGISGVIVTREEWSKLHTSCMVCGASYLPWPLETHEIARGPFREAAIREPAAWIRTCSKCHMDTLDSMPIVEQLAIKKLRDPEHYDRVKVNRLRKRSDEAITELEVDECLRTLGL